MNASFPELQKQKISVQEFKNKPAFVMGSQTEIALLKQVEAEISNPLNQSLHKNIFIDAGSLKILKRE